MPRSVGRPHLFVGMAGDRRLLHVVVAAVVEPEDVIGVRVREEDGVNAADVVRQRLREGQWTCRGSTARRRKRRRARFDRATGAHRSGWKPGQRAASRRPAQTVV
jgi:hypothetical protein